MTPMTKQEKQIPDLITNPDYLENFFNGHITDIDRHGQQVVQLRCYKIKQYLDNQFFHYVLQNNLTIELKNGLRRRYKIFCVSFSGHKRRQMYQVLDLAYHHGFDQGAAIVPRPLWYVNHLMAAFYVGVPGQNFLEHLKNGNLNFKLAKELGRGLLQLHQIKIKPHNLSLSKHSFSLDYLDPTTVLDRDYNKKTKMAGDVKQQFKNLKAIYKKLIDDKPVLSHGDFHPENVIVHEFKNNKLAIIDFSETCLAPVYYDIASFLQQMEFMTRSYITPGQYAKLERAFLTGYWNEVIINDQMQAKINLYKSWTALKSAVYFMIFEDQVNQGFAKYLLRRSQEFREGINL